MLMIIAKQCSFLFRHQFNMEVELPNYEYTNNELIRDYYKSSIIHNSIKHLPSPSTLTVVLNI